MDSIEEQFYKYCLAQNQPYFGSFMYANQGSPIRHAYMWLLVEYECRARGDRPYNILEIGTWAGGSAITWADAIKRFNQGSGFVICVDKWEPYYEPFQREEPGPYRQMDDALSSGEIFELFLHNIRAAGHDDIIIPFKGWSDNLLSLFGSDRFDMVFVDGNHAYTSVLKDIENSARLVSEGGIICGDDLELQLSQLDVEYAKKHRQKDYVVDPRTGREYHPGVSLAVGEFFPEVAVWEGFWATRKNVGHWEKVELQIKSSQRVTVPEHLMEQKVSNYLKFGQELYKTGRTTQAREAFLQAHKLMPDSANVHKALAVVYWKLGNLPKATEHMQCLFRLKPNNLSVKMNYNKMMKILQGAACEKGQHKKIRLDEMIVRGSSQGRYCCSQGAP